MRMMPSNVTYQAVNLDRMDLKAMIILS